jgi:hypothetical protein
MKIFSGLCLSLLLTAGMFAQNRSGFVNAGPPTIRTFPSVVFPGGTSALPGVQRTVGSVVHPGGGGPQIGVPGIRLYNGLNGNRSNVGVRRGGGGVVTTYAYPVAVPVPVYVGGDASYYDQPAPVAAPAPGQTAPTNVIVIYPQSAPQAQSLPVAPPQADAYAQPAAAPAPADSGETATHYLIAFKDHSIYSAVAYWVDGDTLHYFTNGSTHNQVSLSLVDRDLTRQLNEAAGLKLNLPAPK